MGWMFEYTYRNRALTYAEEKAKVIAHYESINTYQPNIDSGLSVRILHVSNARPAWYVAIEVTAPADHNPEPYAAETLPDGRIRYVFGEVMLTKNNRGEWGYECICEASGPTEAKAPESFLKALSALAEGPLTYVQKYGDGTSAEWPTRLGSAINWRAKCRTHHARAKRARALKPGQVIKLAHPALFGEREADTFTVVDPTAYGYRKTSKPAFKLPWGGICTLRAETLAAGFEVIA